MTALRSFKTTSAFLGSTSAVEENSILTSNLPNSFSKTDFLLKSSSFLICNVSSWALLLGLLFSTLVNCSCKILSSETFCASFTSISLRRGENFSRPAKISFNLLLKYTDSRSFNSFSVSESFSHLTVCFFKNLKWGAISSSITRTLSIFIPVFLSFLWASCFFI